MYILFLLLSQGNKHLYLKHFDMSSIKNFSSSNPKCLPL